MKKSSSVQVVPVLLSGGAGTRLWPLSRHHYPKQFLSLNGRHTLLQETVQRLDGVCDLAQLLVVCHLEHRILVDEQIQQAGYPARAILLEPQGRNTAPAIAVAALEALANGDDPVLAIFPADHALKDLDAFHAALERAIHLATQGDMVTFGIAPTTPETGYGYLRLGNPMGGAPAAFQVEAFVEKPPQSQAEAFLAHGGYLWNSGMFLFRASLYLKMLRQFAPKTAVLCQQAHGEAQRNGRFVHLSPAFIQAPSESIDYAVMEHCAKRVAVRLEAGWNDVGAWSSLMAIQPTDKAGNVCSGDVVTHDAHNNLVYATSRLVGVIGLEGMAVVESADAVLVMPLARAQEVKTLVTELQRTGREEVQLHRRVHRLWGCYECIDRSERFQVKRLSVNPGASISLQIHHHRSEHWIIVRGTAQITRGDDCFVLTENQSTYIPLGVKHRLENPGKIPLEVIEVQSGSYLGEDDIVRFNVPDDGAVEKKYS